MKLKIATLPEQEVSNVFFTSDTHFQHAKIIEYCKRPFTDAKDMNEQIIERWNSVVGKDDYVFHLGDIVFGGNYVWDECVAKLNGHIFLIKGNHDAKNIKPKHIQYIDDWYEQLCIYVNGQKIYLSHFPLLCYDGCYDGKTWNLHGHVHLGPHATGIDTERMKLRFPWQIDVGVDAWDYTPVSFNKIKSLMDAETAKYLTLQDLIKENECKLFY